MCKMLKWAITIRIKWDLNLSSYMIYGTIIIFIYLQCVTISPLSVNNSIMLSSFTKFELKASSSRVFKSKQILSV